MRFISTSGDGYELELFAEPTGDGQYHRLAAVVAWKGSRWLGGPEQVLVGIGVGSTRRDYQRIARAAAMAIAIPIQIGVWIGNRWRRWRFAREIRRMAAQRPRWPYIRHDAASQSIRINERAWAIAGDQTRVLLVDAHDPQSGEVLALTEYALGLEPCDLTEPSDEEMRELSDQMATADPERARELAAEFDRRFVRISPWIESLAKDARYQKFLQDAGIGPLAP